MYCCQTVARIKIPLVTEAGLALGPGQIVRWGPSSPHGKGHSSAAPTFRPTLLWHGRPSQQLLRALVYLKKPVFFGFVFVRWLTSFPRRTGIVGFSLGGSYDVAGRTSSARRNRCHSADANLVTLLSSASDMSLSFISRL